MPDQTPQNAAHATNTTPPAPTAPPALTWLQNGTQGRNEWADGYAAARRYYADTAPLAVSSARELVAQFRDQWDQAGQLTGTPVGQFLADLDTILDTAQEPK